VESFILDVVLILWIALGIRPGRGALDKFIPPCGAAELISGVKILIGRCLGGSIGRLDLARPAGVNIFVSIVDIISTSVVAFPSDM
jgi:hypothetical protein